MKKILATLMASTLVLTSTAGAFSDITDASVKQAALSLQSLGVVNGTTATTYSPNQVLTRAEFTTMATRATGAQVSTVGTYSIFADVAHTHWAAPYINVAVRSETPFINGYADGTFRPEAAVNYAEACTMLLRMLGYSIADIGANWPLDYIARAEQLGLNGSLQLSYDTQVTRGMAAILLQQTLTTPTKDGGTLMDTLAGDVTANATLLATSRTDASLSASQARFYINGEPTVLYTSTTLDVSLIGALGTIVYDAAQPTVVQGFLPSGTSEQRTLTGVSASGISTTTGTLTIPRNTPTMVLGEVMEYDECWFDLPVGSAVAIQYTTTGDIALLTALSSLGSSSMYQNGGFGGTVAPSTGNWGNPNGSTTPWQAGETFYYNPYESNNNWSSNSWTQTNPFEGSLLKNGVSIAKSDVDAYDIITTDPVSGMMLVSSTRITGIYDDAAPSFRSPEEITVLGETYTIPASVASQFSSCKEGDTITVLFDVYNRVAGVTTNKAARDDMIGVVTASSGGEVTVALCNGLTIHGTQRGANKSSWEADDAVAVGSMVAVELDDGELDISTAKLPTAKSGDWQVASNRLGSAVVATNVRVFEQNGKSLTALARKDYPTGTVDSRNIERAICDDNGTVIAIVLDDYTGEGWVYGWLTDATDYDAPINPEDAFMLVPDPENPDLTIQVENPDYKPKYDYFADFAYMDADGSAQSVTIDVEDKPSRGMVGIAASVVAQPNREVDLDTRKLYKIDTVDLHDFSGYDTVRAGGATLSLAGDVPVYNEDTKRFMTLRSAKANYDDFTVYADSKSGGTVRMILV